MYSSYFLGAVLLGSALPGRAQMSPAATASTISLVQLNQPPCTVPTAHSVIKAKLAYRLAPTEQSEYGFAVSIKFKGTTPGLTYSKGRLGQLTITQCADTLTLEYPMAEILGDARLARPITCYFYLHRNTTPAPGRSIVVAKTPPIIFKECQ
jgi:hypothetical protein